LRLTLALVGIAVAVAAPARAQSERSSDGKTVTPASAPPPAPPPTRLDKPPKLQRFVQAAAPPELADRGEVDVILTIDVDAAGNVNSVNVAQSGGAAFDEAAVAAARQFLFSPGEAGGQPVPVRITYRYRFIYQPPAPATGSAPATTETGNAPTVDTAPLEGTVLRQGDRVPLGGINVLLDEGAQATSSDAAGHFVLPSVPVGPHVIKLRGPEIYPSDKKLTIKAGMKLTTTWYVAGRQRYTSTVRAQHAVVETVEQTLSGEELRRIPGTQGDTLKAVQNLPGVARAPFGGGQIIVWGSLPQDTRTYVDGVYIPTLYHFGGLRSTVNSEVVSGLDFLPGGYGVDHGRGLGGVIEVETRQPKTNGYHGFAQIDLIDGSFQVEGPITKNLSFSVGARRSWIDIFLPIFTPNDFQLSPIYYDYQAKLHWRASPRDDVDVFIFGSDDQVNVVTRGSADPMLQAQFHTHTYYHRIFARWFHRFANRGTLNITPSFGYDVPFQFNAQFGNVMLNVDDETLEYGLRAIYRQPLGRMVRLDAGADFEGNRWKVGASAPVRGMPREGDAGMAFNGGYATDALSLDSIAFAPYVSLVFTPLKNLVITPQLRLELFDFRGYQNSADAFDHFYALPEPRFNLRYQIVKWAAVKLAAGVYHQPPDPISFLKLFGNPAAKPQYGWHYVVGADFDPTPTLHIEVEGFYKDLRNLVVRGEYPGDPVLTNDGLGRVYGGELLVRQELWHNFFGWIAYTVSRAERKDYPDVPWRVFQYDQTHILTIIGSYKLPRGYQVGIRFRYVTGDPYTAVVGAYYDVNQGVYQRINGPIYGQRLGSFNQLDIRFDKKWTFNRWSFNIYLDIQNVYNASNPEGLTYNYNYTQAKPVAGLPFLPVVGWRGEF
jgi:TonB family protein